MSSKPYNILIILTDQERYFEQYPSGVNRPALTRLQREGISFENHYINSAVCTPSRSTIITGQHIVHTGMFDNLFPWQPDLSTNIPTIGTLMRQASYYTAYKGKWHLTKGFEQKLNYDARPLSMEKYGFSDYYGLGDIIALTRGGYLYDPLTTSQAIHWLRSQREVCQQKGQPWLLMVSLVNPHDVMFFSTDVDGAVEQEKTQNMGIARAPNHSRYKTTYDVPLPSNLHQPIDEAGRPEVHHNYLKIHDLLLGKIPANDDTRWKRYQDYYFNCLRDVDVQLGRLLDELDALGLREDTIIIYTSDHGELGGAHGLHGKGSIPYEEQNHVPFIIAHPAKKKGVHCSALTSHIDLLPTLIGLTQLDMVKKSKLVKDLPGYDLSPLLDDPEGADLHALRPGILWAYNMLLSLDPDFTREVMKAMQAKEKPTARPDVDTIRGAARSIVDGRYRFTRYFAPKQHNKPETLEQILEYNDIELFDLQQDPDENTNLAIEPQKHRQLIESMNVKMNALIEAEIGEDVGQMLPKSDTVSWAVDKWDP